MKFVIDSEILQRWPHVQISVRVLRSHLDYLGGRVLMSWFSRLFTD